MRLEFNPRALCYNLYCDTREEHDKLKQMMEKPFRATDIKNIESMIYADTDSVKTMKTKLNSVYGKVVTDMIKEYIVVHRAKKPIIIFTKSILAVEKDDDGRAIITCSENAVFYVDEKYADVIKQLI